MTTAGPWSVKGIDPKAREVAKDLARRSGLTLGEWLNQMISETAEAPASDAYPEAQATRDWGAREWAAPPPRPRTETFATPTAAEGLRARLQGAGAAADAAEMNRIARALGDLTARIEAAEHRSTLAISGIDQQAMGVLSRIDGVERDQTAVAARFEGAMEDVRRTQTAMAERLRRMGDDDGPRVEAMKALEGALGRVATQLYEGESRARAQTAEMREDVTALVRRMDRAEADRGAAVDTSPLEEAIARLSARIDEAQGRTDTAVRALETSFAGLDARFGEQQDAGAQSFERLAAELSDKVEAARADMTEHLQAMVGGKVEGLEEGMRTLSGQVAAGERKSADAIDRMGREVVRIAQGLGARMDVSERRAQAAADASLAEAHRLHASVEGRLKAADAAQAEAVEKLGSEIAKIAEKLGDRIAAAERRASSELSRGLDDAADRLGRATASLNHRHDQAASELSERIKASEERTARLLEEARASLPAPPPPAPPAAGPEPVFATPSELPPFIARELAAAEPPPVAVAPEPAPEPPAPEPAAAPAFVFTAPPPTAGFAGLPTIAELAGEIERGERPAPPPPFVPARAELEEDDFAFADTAFPTEALDGRPAHPSAPFADAEFEEGPAAEPAPPGGFVMSPFGHTIDAQFDDPLEPMLAPAAPADEAIAPPPPEPAEVAARASSTRELIEQARAAARQNAEAKSRKGSKGAADLFSVPAPGFEDAAAAPPAKRGPFGLPPLLRKKREGASVRTALFASGLAATISMVAAGAILMNASEGGDHHGDAPSAAPLAGPQTAALSPTHAPAAETLAVATAPTPAAALSPAAPSEAPAVAPPVAEVATAAAPASAKLLYSDAVRQIEGGDNSGVAALKRAANLGYAPAQFYLGRLYQEGRGGLKADVDEGRRWTERAARAGDPRAMFSLGLSYANGLPGGAGATDDRSAVSWFRSAADHGLRDAQFNLAVMHQSGRGVPKSPAEAYKWFLIAAAGGDAEARASADALKSQLSPEALAVAERSAQAFRAQGAAAQVRTASAN